MSAENASASAETATAAAASASGEIEQGSYEILRQRLREQSRELKRRAEALNQQRLDLFGSTELVVIGNRRIRTENNCVPRDVQSIGRHLLFGYNVFLGLRTETRVADVLSLHAFAETDDGFTFEPVADDDPANFLADPGFVRDFGELYSYYKETRLNLLRKVEGKLLAVFQTGKQASDLKVFRWAVDAENRVTYIDNRGERDHVFPPSHDFEWTATGRGDFVLGRHPHVNILDQVFVETVGGDLTVKVEDNTEDGLGIYREAVDDADQSLDDGEIHYARLGSLIVIKVLPYNETAWRYLVFNTRTRQVDRIDAIGQSCVQLPEDHGLIFPGGYYLRSGETKTFEGDVEDMELKRVVRSPNGEDVLYVFHERASGRYILLPYNLIRKEVQNPIHCNGFGLFDDGKMVLFRILGEEPTRVHPMQIWQTPFLSDEHAAAAPSTGSFLEKVGNADLVRGISDALSLFRMVEEQEPTQAVYEDLIATAVRMGDAYYWLDEESVGELGQPIRDIRQTADLIVGEFQKVQALRRRARDEVEEATATLRETLRQLAPEHWREVDLYVEALSDLRRQRGHLIGLRELRYVDLEALDALEEELLEAQSRVGGHSVEFLKSDDALVPYHRAIERQVARIDEVAKVSEAEAIGEKLQQVGDGLELLTEMIGSLEIDDATVRTAILERISEVLGQLNRGRALLQARRQELLEKESGAEFGAQFKLFGQAVSGALALAETPEKCDELLSKLLLQLEELESRFGELDRFLEPLATKREEVYEAFSSKKQTLVEARQRRAMRLDEAADRILGGIVRRAAALEDGDALNAYFAADAMVAKVRDLAAELRGLKDSVRADELESRLKAARQDAARALRDRQDLFEDGAEILRFGRHRFSVNSQPLELTLVPYAAGSDRRREAERVLAFHLTGTDFHQPVDDPAFAETREFWDQILISENAEVYRGEYLAYRLLRDAEEHRGGLSLAALHEIALGDGGLLQKVRAYAAERYDEGYERGVHDHDASSILEKLLALTSTAGLLRFPPRARAAACLFWAHFPDQMKRALWERRVKSLERLRRAFAHSPEVQALQHELADEIDSFLRAHDLAPGSRDARLAGRYLFEELALEDRRFVVSAAAEKLRDRFRKHLEAAGTARAFDEDLRELGDDLRNAWHLAEAWLTAFLAGADEEEGERAELERAVPEVVVLLLAEQRLERGTSHAQTTARVTGLLGQHRRIEQRTLEIRLDDFLTRLETFAEERVPAFRRFQEARHRLLEAKRRELRLEEFEPRVMSAFVRNQLIDKVYLPLIGDNLAKQIGAAGEGKRTDQMGLLLLISPPGYGKTTLMEYIANRLGMTFVKVNGPALGHAVTSLDPSEAPNATARQEVDKINFALEMGNNVLLYLDDIQHTHPELLQKFISLCDAQRRIEGVWNGRTRTYDLRGKRFAVCMAGNPYTESGEKFQIPDMLANRADTYNLGDILEGRDDLFALSYLENALTSNPALAPLSTREPEDFFKLVRMAQGEPVPADQLTYNFSQVELEEILSVLRKLLRVQQVLLAVNQQYIASAAQDDAFRTEPRFQLQGSYRNMNKLAEKIAPVMNEAELEALIDDHYAGEAQTLTTGAEHNLLKLAELRGTLDETERARWEEIKRGFARVQVMGGAEDDPAVRMIGQLAQVSDRLLDIGRAVETAASAPVRAESSNGDFATALAPYLDRLQQTLEALQESRSAPAAEDGPDDEAAAWARLAGRVEMAVERLGQFPTQLATALAETRTLSHSPPPAPAPSPESTSAEPGTDFSPYLEKLDQTLQTLASRPSTEVVQTLDPGVYELLGRMSDNVAETLLPLVQRVGRQLKASADVDRGTGDLLDKTLRNLDMLKDLLAALRKIDTRRVGAS